MSRVRICFLGTPDFAVTCLQAIEQDEHFEVVGVVTQPDRPAGRKLQLQPSAVKSFCITHNLRCISPENINEELILQEIQKWGAELAIVVAFGQILSDQFFKLFPFGAFNVHGSLLPKWRGAAPIQRAIEAGDVETGVALQKMVKKLDAGDVLGLRKCVIIENMTATELYQKLANLGAELLTVELMDYVRGNLMPQPQDETKVTYAKKIDKAEAEIDWNQPAKNIHNKVRAFTMGPGTWTTYQGKKLKILKTQVHSPEGGSKLDAGKTILQEARLLVQTGQGVLEIIELQPESRSKIMAGDFVRGYQVKQGDQLGNAKT